MRVIQMRPMSVVLIIVALVGVAAAEVTSRPGCKAAIWAISRS